MIRRKAGSPGGDPRYDTVEYTSEEITARYGRTAQRPMIRATASPGGRCVAATGDAGALPVVTIAATCAAAWIYNKIAGVN